MVHPLGAECTRLLCRVPSEVSRRTSKRAEPVTERERHAVVRENVCDNNFAVPSAVTVVKVGTSFISLQGDPRTPRLHRPFFDCPGLTMVGSWMALAVHENAQHRQLSCHGMANPATPT
jgi:hypothetical protein